MNKEEKIQYANYLIEEITTKFLQKDNPYIITEGYEYLREVITLYAKQSNLFESALLLLENNHSEEAYVLVRSMLNNTMLIHYLCNDETGERYKDYKIQPTKSELSFLYDIKKALKNGWMKEEPPELDKKIKQYQEFLMSNGFVKTIKTKKGKKRVADTKLMSIKGMALTDELLFGHYQGFYREGSKYEHSDFSSLSIYRTPVSEEYPDTVAFILDLSKTDPELEEKVLNLAITIYSLTYLNLLQHITNKQSHLITDERKPDLAKLALVIQSNDFHFPYENEESNSSTDNPDTIK
ncbi:DUF5677 domain-containing protein [Halobacillus trueperi]|uniref:DUF5677 domain-containing protein n=1 Tax=Halobacillus trueperi TaxID=156205 RepID=UPI0015F24B6B|nr:DUF5677 domain-containing protein [Halobacillus trueperi]